MTPEREAALRGLAERLGHRFRDLALLDRALTHTSFAHEALEDGAGHNEPLEFLGDAVIGFVVAEMLHQRDPEGHEGGKSKLRARVVRARSLAGRARAADLPDLLRLGRGEEKTGGRLKQALWADAYEAVVAALYLDGGLDAAARFVRRDLGEGLEAAVAADAGDDPKSALQEVLQARGEAVPDYVVIAEEGPDHRKQFRVQCRIGGEIAGEGVGHSKKEAQQDAARRGLEAVRSRGTGGEVR
jgi:ribonuclease III